MSLEFQIFLGSLIALVICAALCVYGEARKLPTWMLKDVSLILWVALFFSGFWILTRAL